MQKNRTIKNAADAESKVEPCSGVVSGDIINSVSDADGF